MDLYFQGLAWFNKGMAPDNLAQARSFFDRALLMDPDNVDALVESARAGLFAGVFFVAPDLVAALAAAEAKFDQSLILVPEHARAHMSLGIFYIFTKRAAPGIAQCEHALALDRNLAAAHTNIGFGTILIGRAEETEAHISEALRLSPRDTFAHGRMTTGGIAKNSLGSYEQAVAWFRRAIEANPNQPQPHFVLGATLALLGRIDEARSAVRAGLALNPAFTIARTRAAWTVLSDDPTYLAQLEGNLDGLRKAGLPEQ
jgi:tetratricopeptide (TPR) repeat protein